MGDHVRPVGLVFWVLNTAVRTGVGSPESEEY